MERINDKWVRLWGIALLILNAIVNSPTMYSHSLKAVLLGVLYNILLVIIIWEGDRFFILLLRRKTPVETSNRQRLLFTLGIITVYNFIIFFITFKLLKPFPTETNRQWMHVIISLIISSIVSGGFLLGIYEALYYFNRLNKVEQEKKELVRINLQGQFDSLKGQVNPHFLFNSLNSLRQLVLKDPPKAAHYVEELSDVYRYLLRNNDGELTSLKNELDFIQSYCHLLQTRFGDGLQVHIEVSDTCGQYLLPPLTLQMLFENAVKHNIISANQPLHIRVTGSDDATLRISNNLQKKMQPVQSEKIGLANIITKYKYLGQPDVVVQETDNEFIVVLPLIKNASYENTDR
jgi:two-component system, LytTR family, sensor kinase